MILIKEKLKNSICIYLDLEGAKQLLIYLNELSDAICIDKSSIGLNDKSIRKLKVELLQEENNKFNGFIKQEKETLILSFFNEKNNDPDDYSNLIEYFIDRIKQYIEYGNFYPAEFIDLLYLDINQVISLYFFDYKRNDSIFK